MGFLTNDGYIGIGRQTAKGATAVPTWFLRYLTGTYNPENVWKEQHEGGFSRYGRIAEKVGMNFSGGFTLNSRADLAGLLFTMVLGSDVKTGVSVPYLHTITPADLIWWSFEFERLNNLVRERVIDCKLNTLTFKGSAGEPLTLEVEFMGLNEDGAVTGATEVYGTEKYLKFLNGVFTILGETVDEIEDFTLTITNNLEAIQTRMLNPQQLVEKNLDIGLDFTIKATLNEQFRKIYYGGTLGTVPSVIAEKSQVIFTFNNGLATTLEREIKVTIAELTFQAMPLTGLNAEGEVYRYAGTGIATNNGTDPLIQVEVKNAEVTAYDGA